MSEPMVTLSLKDFDELREKIKNYEKQELHIEAAIIAVTKIPLDSILKKYKAIEDWKMTSGSPNE